MTHEILRMVGISKAFSGIHALEGVNFSCNSGEVHVLAGENGAGKSTLLKILAGIYHADAGKIFIHGQEKKIASPKQSQQAGVAMVFQELTLIEELSVEENIFLHAEPHNAFGLMAKKQLREKALNAMDRFGIQLDPGIAVGRLPVALKQMTEILKVLVREPEIIILDEPTSALAQPEVQQLFTIIRNLTALKKSIVFISHRLEEVFAIGDRVTVLKDGRNVDTKHLKDISESDLIRLMIGRSLDGTFPKKHGISGTETAFAVEKMTTSDKKVQNISFDVKRGEVLGIAGLQGHGQSDLLMAIAGLKPCSTGEMTIRGTSFRARHAMDAVAKGVVLVPADRKSQGLMLDLSIRQNLAISSLKNRVRGPFIDLQAEKQFVQSSVDVLSIKVSDVNNPVHTLSGGNQQKVVLGKILALKPKVILFDEPTRGIDVESKREFYHLIFQLAEEGVAVIMNSSDLMEVIGMCDRVLVMYEGKVSGILKKDELTEERIMRYAMGLTSGEERSIVGEPS